MHYDCFEQIMVFWAVPKNYFRPSLQSQNVQGNHIVRIVILNQALFLHAKRTTLERETISLYHKVLFHIL